VLKNEVYEEEDDKEDLKVNRLMTDRIMKLIDVPKDVVNGKLKLLRAVPEVDESLYRALPGCNETTFISFEAVVMEAKVVFEAVCCGRLL